MAGNILYLNISLVSSKCLFEVWLFDKGGMDDKIAMIAMRRRIFRKSVPTSNPQQSCVASLSSRVVPPYKVVLALLFSFCSMNMGVESSLQLYGNVGSNTVVSVRSEHVQHLHASVSHDSP